MAFQPGQSGNPKGRRQEKPFADALRMELLAAGEDHKALRLVARKLIESAQEGKMDAIKELIDRTDGKPMQAFEGELTHEAGDSIATLMAAINGRTRTK